MKILSIHNNIQNFGKKIPVANCQIKDMRKNKFIKATIYELDCKDTQDFDEISRLNRRWTYSSTMLRRMKAKNSPETKDFYKDSQFFVIQDKDKKTLGLAQTTNNPDFINIDFIESHPDKSYKYVGQSLIGMIGKNVLAQNKYSMMVKNPVHTTSIFYKNTCGFESIQNGMLMMDSTNIKSFINNLERKTKSPIIDIKG